MKEALLVSGARTRTPWSAFGAHSSPTIRLCLAALAETDGGPNPGTKSTGDPTSASTTPRGSGGPTYPGSARGSASPAALTWTTWSRSPERHRFAMLHRTAASDASESSTATMRCLAKVASRASGV